MDYKLNSSSPTLVQLELNKVGENEEKSTKLNDFDDVLDVVGGQGKYQKRVLYLILGSFMLFIDMPFLNKIFMLSIPPHTCHVPGRPLDIDLMTWQNMTLPKEIGPDGNERFSQCQMLTPNGTVPCTSWDFDKTDYDSTIPTEFNWVCDKSHYATNVFTFGFTGNVIGSIFFGPAADRWGRKPIVYLTLVIYLSLQIINLFTPKYYAAYLTIQFMSESTMPFLFITPVMLTAEISGKAYRGWIFSASCMIWVVGCSMVPLLSWLLRSWFYIGLATNLPVTLLLFLYCKMPESPRWLIGQGRVKEAEQIIHDIGRVNKRPIDSDQLHQFLCKMVEDKTQEEPESLIKGTWLLFSKKRLARNTILICTVASVSRLLCEGLTFNSTSMMGNEFLNFFLLGLIELPAAFLAGVFVDRMGRRWTHVGLFVLCAGAFVVAGVTVFKPQLSWVVLVAAVTAKFGCGASSVVTSLQETEIFPTQLRSTGNGISSLVSSIVGISGPYIVYVGTFSAAAPYILLGLLSLVGIVAAAYLPETHNLNLPETLEEADEFSRRQKFWSFLPNKMALRDKDIGDNEERENIHKIK